MNRIRRTPLWLSLLGILPLLWVTVGCQNTPRQQGVQAAPDTAEREPVDVMAQSDAARAEAAIERDRREMSGERRPRDRRDRDVVDQPRVGRQR